MATVASSGASKSKDTRGAVAEAVRAARAGLNGAKASYGFLFAGPHHSLRAALAEARAATGDAHLVGCSTAGEFDHKGLMHGGLVVMLVAADGGASAASFASGLKTNVGRVAEELARSDRQLRDRPDTRDKRHSTTILLTDGLSGTAEKLVVDLRDKLGSGSQIVGGAAGDEGAFKATYVGAGANAETDAAAALHVVTATPWGIGVGHGLRPTTKPMRVTRANANVVYELDGEPAFEAYKRHASDRGVNLTRENAAPYLIGNELGIHFFERIVRARAPLSAGVDGSLSCAAEIPKGAMVSILDGEPASMVDAAKSAAEEARARLGGVQAAGVLLFDCVCRGMILKDAFQREIDAVRSVFGGVPVAGFLTYGEIARYQGNLDGWHNATAVVAAIPK
jgi:methyl-accepting chemotaxis protein